MPSVVEETANSKLLRIVEGYMKNNKIKRDDDVHDIFLGNCGLTDLDDLGRFRFLQRIWLHENKLGQLCLPNHPRTSFVNINYRISELYLNDNDIKSVAGMLSHLRCLKVLMLQNNQLDDLDETTLELKPMRTLNVLNMLYNPLSQVKGYRLHLIHHCPSLQLFDRQAVTANERSGSSQIYEEKQNAVKATIAFGRRAHGPPIFRPRSKSPVEVIITEHKELASEDTKQPEQTTSLDELVEERMRKKASMQYTTLDWSAVPDRQKRILGEATPRPQNITIHFR